MKVNRAQLQIAAAMLPQVSGTEAFEWYRQIDALVAEGKRKLVAIMQQEVELPPAPESVKKALENSIEVMQYTDALKIKPILDAYTAPQSTGDGPQGHGDAPAADGGGA